MDTIDIKQTNHDTKPINRDNKLYTLYTKLDNLNT